MNQLLVLNFWLPEPQEGTRWAAEKKVTIGGSDAQPAATVTRQESPHSHKFTRKKQGTPFATAKSTFARLAHTCFSSSPTASSSPPPRRGAAQTHLCHPQHATKGLIIKALRRPFSQAELSFPSHLSRTKHTGERGQKIKFPQRK